MKKNRVDAVLKNLEQMGLSQMLITDPLAIFYLTGRLIQPLERFYGLYLNQNGGHKIFINQLETVPEDLGVEKVRYTDTDPYLDMVAAAIDRREPLGVDKNMAAPFSAPAAPGERGRRLCERLFGAGPRQSRKGSSGAGAYAAGLPAQ